MGQALAVTRVGHTAGIACRGEQERQRGPGHRLLAIALVLDGDARTEAAEQTGMDRQTPRDWVHRYNATGIDGLKSRGSPGRVPLLTGEQKAELKALVIERPDPERDKVVRWRCVDLREEIARRLRQLGLTRLRPRPFHPKKDAAAQEAFKKDFSTQLKAALLGCTVGTPIEIWCQSLPSGLTRGTKPGSGRRERTHASGRLSARVR